MLLTTCSAPWPLGGTTIVIVQCGVPNSTDSVTWSVLVLNAYMFHKSMIVELVMTCWPPRICVAVCRLLPTTAMGSPFGVSVRCMILCFWRISTKKKYCSLNVSVYIIRNKSKFHSLPHLRNRLDPPHRIGRLFVRVKLLVLVRLIVQLPDDGCSQTHFWNFHGRANPKHGFVDVV